MGTYQYALAALLGVLAAALSVLLFAVVVKRHKNAGSKTHPRYGYAGWLEQDATDKFPREGKCGIFDFGLQTKTLDTKKLDLRQSRTYAKHETCTDSNQVYAAKVKRVCKEYLAGTEGLINRCHLGGGKVSKVGDFSYVYSSDFCQDKGAMALCRGVVAEFMVMDHPVNGPDARISKLHRYWVLPVSNVGYVFTANDIFHITLYSSEGKVGDIGQYAAITHKQSGQIVSPGNVTPGGMWRILKNCVYFENKLKVPDIRLVFVGVPVWKSLPVSDEEFSLYAAKTKLDMARLDVSASMIKAVPINRNDDPACRFNIRNLNYSPP